MIDIRVIPNRNICFIKLSGQTTENQLIDVKKRIFNALNVLGRRKILVNDISELDPLKSELLIHIKEIQEYASEIGVTKVIRIVKDKTIQSQFMQSQENSNAKYETVQVGSLSEAMIAAQ